MATTAERLKEAMVLRGLRQKDICEMTGIGKSAISQYLAGKNAPKQDKLFLLSEALNVSPTWLMGADVPIERVDRYYLNSQTARMAQELMDNPNGRMLFNASRDLSPEDVKIVLNLIEGLKAKEGK